MKICYLVRRYPPRTGGPSSLVYRIGKELARRGFEVSVITQHAGNTPNFELSDGVKIYRTLCLKNEFSFSNLFLSTIAYTRKVLSKINENDIFHAMDISIAGFGGLIGKCFSKKPFFIKYGGDLIFEYLSLKKVKGWDPKTGVEGAWKFNNWRIPILRAIQNMYMKKYDLILPDSYFGMKFLEENGVPKEKMKLLINGVDTEKFKVMDKNAAKRKLHLSGDIILTTSRLVAWKGVDIAIKSLKHVKDAKLVVVGGGPELTNLKKMVGSLGLKERVIFLGEVQPNLMTTYINASDVFLLPSYFDTTPNALLEAMSCGKPAVVSNIEGMKEVIEDGGITVPVGDHIALADAVEKLLNEKKLLEKMGRKNRENVIKKYSWERMIKEYIKLYESWM